MSPDDLLAPSPSRAEQSTAPRTQVLHAPTPSDEPLPWPALLVGTFPLDPARRHVAAGPATDALVREAAAGYADLLAEVAAAGRTPWDLVPVGLPAGALDGALRAALADLLPGTAFLVGAEPPPQAPDGGPTVLRPRDAVALDPPAGADAALVAALAPTVAGLVLVPRGARAAADLVGVRRIGLGDVVEQLPTAGPPDRWRDLYDALTEVALDASGREALSALPVLLADGRAARGARGVVLPGGPPEVALALAALGARSVHPDAAHPLLERLGAASATPRAALDLAAVRESAEAAAAALEDDDEQAWDDDLDGGGADPEARVDRVADAVLAVVAAAVADAALAPGEVPWLGDLLLRDADGEAAPARELVLPGSVAAAVLDPQAVGVVADDLVDAWGRDVLVAAGVLDGLALVRVTDAALDPDPADDAPVARLDAWPDWCDAARDAAPVLAGTPDVRVADLTAVADLDVVDPDRWPALLAAVAADPALRAAVVEPATLLGGARGAVRVPSYTAWWLRRELGATAPWADPDAGDAVGALLPPGPEALRAVDAGLRAALGAVRELDGLDASVVGPVLARLADDDLVLDTPTALRLWATLARVAVDAADLLDPDRPEPHDGQGGAPDRVRVLDPSGASTRVVPASAAAVVGSPKHLQPGLLAGHDVTGAVVVAAGRAEREALADLLDVPLAEDVVRGVVAEDGHAAGRRSDVPDAVRLLLPGAPATWCEHEVLQVDGVEVDWWVDGPDDGPDDGRTGTAAVVHACTLDGLARGLADAAGAWSRRSGVAAVLEDPAALGPQLVDDAFG